MLVDHKTILATLNMHCNEFFLEYLTQHWNAEIDFVNSVGTEIPDCVARAAGAEERYGRGAAALLMWEQSSGPALAASAGDRRDSAHRSEDETRGAAAGRSRAQDDGTRFRVYILLHSTRVDGCRQN